MTADIDWNQEIRHQIVHPRVAGQGLQRLDSSYQHWVAGVAQLGDDDLAEPAGPAGTPMAVWSTARIVLHTQRELIHHGAEIAPLRDLYRASGGGKSWTDPAHHVG